MLTVEQALTRIAQTVTPARGVPLPLDETLGAVLAEDIVSDADSPPFDKSMMDGYAVRSRDLESAGANLRVIGEVTAGRVATQGVSAGTTLRIMTGAPIPDGADAVVPLEQVRTSGEGVSLSGPVAISPGTNIVRRGSNMRSGEVILRAGRSLRAQELALLAELGRSQPRVRRQPTVAILATGDELVEVDETPGPGQIRNSNALMLAAQVRQLGASACLLGIARDNADDLGQRISAGLRCDFLVLSGGVSAGKLDLVPALLSAAGVEEVFHKVSMKPGKPVWFGQRPGNSDAAGCYVFGLPGNPVSSMVCFELFVRAALRAYLGVQPAETHTAAILVEPFQHRSDRPTWFPAIYEVVEGQCCVRPVDWKGSSDLRSTVDANCSLKLPAGDVSLSAGSRVEILRWGD